MVSLEPGAVYLLQLVRRVAAALQPAPSSGSSENFTFHPWPQHQDQQSCQPSSHAAGHRDGEELLCVTVTTVSCQDSIRHEDAGETASGHLLALVLEIDI